MKILSPAKINLMLRVLGQRDDGYHLLQTYFQLLDWGDWMGFKDIKHDNIEIEGDFGDLPQTDNLIYKAAQLLLPYKKTTKGIQITVDKNIPQGSGLGGGSSNAGITLRILNELWQCNLSQDDLIKIGTTLGADVPIFVLNQSAMATGIGEKLIPFNIKNYIYVLIFPPKGISTTSVFSNKDLERNQKPIETKTVENINNWTNACLPVVLNNYPEIQEYYNIASNFNQTHMSGTGSTLFSSFETEQEAQAFINKCPEYWNTQICLAHKSTIY